MNPPDLLDLKGQVAVALVESILRRAGYRLTPFPHQHIPPHLGREDLPDFTAAPVTRPEAARFVKVRYRRRVEQYLAIEARRGPRSFFALARHHWPGLVVIFVADEPEPGHSCFRVLDLAGGGSSATPALLDLSAHPNLNIYQANVEEHEALARRLLGLFTMLRPHRVEENTG